MDIVTCCYNDATHCMCKGNARGPSTKCQCLPTPLLHDLSLSSHSVTHTPPFSFAVTLCCKIDHLYFSTGYNLISTWWRWLVQAQHSQHKFQLSAYGSRPTGNPVANVHFWISPPPTEKYHWCVFQGHPGVTTGAMTPPTIDSPPCSSGGEGSSLSGGGIINYALGEAINEKKSFLPGITRIT